jgi:hypothetical protein
MRLHIVGCAGRMRGTPNEWRRHRRGIPFVDGAGTRALLLRSAALLTGLA